MPETYIDLEDGSKIVSRKSFLKIRRVIEEYPKSDFKELKIKDGDRLLIGDTVGIAKSGEEIKSSNSCNAMIKDESIYLIGQEASLNIKSGSKIVISINDVVKKGETIAEFDPYAEPIICDLDGIVKFEDIIEGITLRTGGTDDNEEIESGYGIIHEVKDGSLAPKVILESSAGELRIPLPSGAILLVDDGKAMKAGDIIAKIPRQQVKQKDITGGLPRVAELFEARKPKDACVIAEDDGVIEFWRAAKG